MQTDENVSETYYEKCNVNLAKELEKWIAIKAVNKKIMKMRD
jgi:flagellar basal body rod protein FlgG